VFFTPSDVAPPPGVVSRLSLVADAAERFLVAGMTQWKYPPARQRFFRRTSDGSVEVLFVRGEHPLASGRYQKPTFAQEAIDRATNQFKIAGDRHLWWVFSYLGEPPLRVTEYLGHGNPRDGGWAIVNYSTIPGEIRPDRSLGDPFHERWTLKGCIHELGHAFGLPHVGPTPRTAPGVTLMGPNLDVYARSKLPNPDRVHLSEAVAAMLWKHPVFSGDARDRAREPAPTLSDYRPSFSRAQGHVLLTGKLTSDVPAHSVVVLDDVGKPDDTYWYRGYAARLSPDGRFRVEVTAPAATDGHYHILFCFNNGAVTGGVPSADDHHSILKGYRYRGGRYVFGD
jgi:hypothetical protein